MIVVYDDNATLNLDNFAKEVGIQNSKGEVIYGEGLETYTGLIYIIRYPKDQVDKIFQDEKNFIINLKDSKNKYHQVKFQTNYSSDIPKPIHELVELLAK